jgi:hypothetical protein
MMRVFGLVRFRNDRRTSVEELAAATLAAKVECLPVAFGTARGRSIDSHATYRVNRHDRSNLSRYQISNTDSSIGSTALVSFLDCLAQTGDEIID